MVADGEISIILGFKFLLVVADGESLGQSSTRTIACFLPPACEINENVKKKFLK